MTGLANDLHGGRAVAEEAAAAVDDQGRAERALPLRIRQEVQEMLHELVGLAQDLQRRFDRDIPGAQVFNDVRAQVAIISGQRLAQVVG